MMHILAVKTSKLLTSLFYSMVAIHLPLDSLSGRGSYGMKGEMPLVEEMIILNNVRKIIS